MSLTFVLFVVSIEQIHMKTLILSDLTNFLYFYIFYNNMNNIKSYILIFVNVKLFLFGYGKWIWLWKEK